MTKAFGGPLPKISRDDVVGMVAHLVKREIGKATENKSTTLGVSVLEAARMSLIDYAEKTPRAKKAVKPTTAQRAIVDRLVAESGASASA